jgi:PIN domain nuclease of toxin-antitoxin system
VGNDPRLGQTARQLIGEVGNECWVSLASCWELAIKQSLGKITLVRPLGEFLSKHMNANGFSLLPIEFPHVVAVATLPFRHRDPFDRLIIAQALTERLVLLSVDGVFDDYGVDRRW